MIINFSLSKPPVNSHTLQLNTSCAPSTQHVIPSGREKVKTNNYESNNNSLEKNTKNCKIEKIEPKQFKIRTYNHKQNNKSVGIQGRPINHVLAIERLPEKRRQMTDQELSKMINKRCSVANTPKDKSASKEKQKQLFVPSCKNKDKVFDELDVFKNSRQHELEFKAFNMDKILPLAHKVELSLNDFSDVGMNMSLSKKFVLIVSFKLINQEIKKYKSSLRSYSSQNLANQSIFSNQTANILKILAGPQGSKSFFKRCRLFFKVSDGRELTLLENYLSESNLDNYAGIFNVQDKYTESVNLYNLKGIASKDDNILLIEDKNALQYEIPTINGQNISILLPKHSGYLAVTQLIESLKGIETSYQSLSPAKSPIKYQTKGSQITDDSDKENISPNFLHMKLMKSSIRKGYESTISPSKKKQIKMLKPKLNINGKLTMRPFDIDINKLILKSNCVVSSKLIRIHSKNRLSKEKEESQRSVSIKNIRDKSFSRQKKQNHFESVKTPLEGNFKDKMVTYIKILQVEKRQKQQQKEYHEVERRQEYDVVDELTNNITSKLKNKTNYQMVGELLRNNSHIAKQINKYLTKATVLESSLRQIEEKRQFESVETDKKPFQLMVYDFE